MSTAQLFNRNIASRDHQIMEYDTDEIRDDDWRMFIARTWVDYLNDSREDVYTLDDGVLITTHS